MHKLRHLIFITGLGSMALFNTYAQENSIHKKVQDLMAKMTIEEKIGQLVQVSGEEVTGPQGEKINITEYIQAGKIGSCLNIYGTENVIRMQKAAIEGSRLKIPLLFGLDVIHGYKTIFPVPIALASSWDSEIVRKAQRTAAREVARESIVLLKNENNLLPLNMKNIKSIAIVGPLAESKRDPIGPWCAAGLKDDTVSVLDAIKEIVPNGTVLNYQKGSGIEDDDDSMADAAINAALMADIIIAVLGESSEMSGEAASRSSIEIPETQKNLLKGLYSTGKPIVLVLTNGRPLDLSWEAKHIPAILETWFPGTEGGNAIADILFGKHNPSGKLPITFPKSLGQVPIFYNHLMCGRPATPETVNQKYVSKYLDIDNDPLYPFGYGLTYTTFSYSPILLDKKEIKVGDCLTASVEIKIPEKWTGKKLSSCTLEML